MPPTDHDPPRSDSLIVMQGRSEVESDLLRNILEHAGIETFHVPSAESALMGRVSRTRFAFRATDRPAAEETLRAAGLQLEDFRAVKSAYNLDEPFHRAFGGWSLRFTWGAMLWVAALIALILYFAMVRQ